MEEEGNESTAHEVVSGGGAVPAFYPSRMWVDTLGMLKSDSELSSWSDTQSQGEHQILYNVFNVSDDFAKQ